MKQATPRARSHNPSLATIDRMFNLYYYSGRFDINTRLDRGNLWPSFQRAWYMALASQ